MGGVCDADRGALMTDRAREIAHRSILSCYCRAVAGHNAMCDALTADIVALLAEQRQRLIEVSEDIEVAAADAARALRDAEL